MKRSAGLKAEDRVFASMGFATRAIHVGQPPDKATGAIVVPIYQTATYVQEAPGKHKGYEYSRTGNPTRTALEACLASLEGCSHGLAFSSGLAASSAVLTLLKHDDHVVVCDDVYGGTRRLFEKVLTKYGLTFTFVDATRPEPLRAAMKRQTKLVWLESPTNPLLKVIDIEAAAGIVRARAAMLVVDNTFMTPYFQNPLSLGADLVVHSTTKYLGGHSDIIGGAVLTSNARYYEDLKFIQNAVGAVPAPFDCWLVLRGLKTLAVRMERHESNARHLAKFLSQHPRVKRVRYPGLPEHPQHKVAVRQMKGFGGLISFEVNGGLPAARRLLKRVKVFSLAESLGGVESLIEIPSLMTHASVPREARLKLGIADDLIRLSVGIEDVEDLVADLRQALL